MNDKSNEMMDALTLAIYREIGARDFYARIAGGIANMAGKMKFEQMSRDEEGHRVKLESWFRDLSGREFEAEEKRLKESEIRGVEIGEQSGAVEALDIAIEAEQKARDFYLAQAGRAEDPELSKLFNDLAAEEGGHYNLLSAERNALIGGFYWFDMDSTSFLED